MTRPVSGENGSTPSPSTARGPRRLRAVGSAAGAESAPRALERPTHNLPLELSSFVGREREVAEVKDRLTDTRLLTLTDPGGCGKTRLALAVASELVEDFEDGTLWVALASLSDPDLMPQGPAAISRASAFTFSSRLSLNFLIPCHSLASPKSGSTHTARFLRALR
jgi:hypothetical protein